MTFIKAILAKLGNVTDIWVSHKTVLGYTNVSYQHVHNPAYCYPTLANGVQVNTDANVWVLGNYTELIPTNTITKNFDIHWIQFENASANGVYELHLFRGEIGQEVFIGQVRTTRDSNQSGTSSVPIQVPVIPANSRISARVASNGGNRNVTLSVYYHDYDNQG